MRSLARVRWGISCDDLSMYDLYDMCQIDMREPYHASFKAFCGQFEKGEDPQSFLGEFDKWVI